MDKSQPQEFTEAIIKRYLDAEVYLQRGMTREQYVQLCKEKWDNRAYDPATETKIIIDFLMPPADHPIGDKESFDYFESYEEARYNNEGNTGLECLIKRDVILSFQPGMGFPGLEIVGNLTEEIKHPEFFNIEDTLEQGLFLVALFDILGFSNLVNRVGSSGIVNIYQKLINLTILSKSYKSYERVRIAPNKYIMGTIYVPVQHTYFSDTIILWIKVEHPTFHVVSPFIQKCADLLCEALNLGIPLRGSVSIGEGTMHKSTMTYIGKAINEAAKLEKEQKWIGASFCNSFMIGDLLESINEKLITGGYCKHLKNTVGEATPYLSIDWTRQWKFKNYPDLRTTLTGLMVSAPDKNKEYYQNTIDFINFSELQDDKSRLEFLRSKTYRFPDISKWDAESMSGRFVIIKFKDGQFVFGKHYSFSLFNPKLVQQVPFIVILPSENIQKLDSFVTERLNEKHRLR